jgi:hypothetical protein
MFSNSLTLRDNLSVLSSGFKQGYLNSNGVAVVTEYYQCHYCVLQNTAIEMRIQAAGRRVGGTVEVFFKSSTDLSAVIYN